MQDKFKEYQTALEEAIRHFERHEGDLLARTIKHFFCCGHSMDLKEDAFFDPALAELEKYEKWLDE